MKNRMIVLALVVLICSLMLSFVGHSGSAAAAARASVKIRIASDLADQAPQSIALYQFEKDVERLSNGEINVENYTNNALGVEIQFTDALTHGSVEMAAIGTGFASRFHPFAAFDCPYLLTSWDETEKILSTDYAKNVFKDMPAKTGVRFIAFAPIGFRAFASIMPLNKLDDLKGKKCRAANISVYVKMIRNFGANPVVFSLTELFPALEQKAVDALELPVGTISTFKYYEVAKYVTDTKHMMTMHILAVNEKFWESLSKQHQDIIMKAAAMFQKNDIDLYAKYEQSVFKEMASKGAIVSEPSESFKKELIASQANIEDIIEADHPGSKAVIQGIRSLLRR
jgi:tripartite ATP-independent transporter DctP family solute receptor